MGMIRRPWWSEASGLVWPGHRGYTSTLFEGHPGIFNDQRESGPRFNVSSEGHIHYIHTTVAQMAVKTGFPLNAVCCYTLPARDKKKNHFANYIEKNTIKMKKEWHIKQVIVVFIYFSCVVNKILLINKKKCKFLHQNNSIFYFILDFNISHTITQIIQLYRNYDKFIIS